MLLAYMMIAAAAAAAQAPCDTLESRTPNAPQQRPAFPGHTRACKAASNVAFEVEVLAKGLEHPWAVEPLPGGDLLVTERPGRLRIITAGGNTGQPIQGLPKVDARGQGGLLDVALSPEFAKDRTIFWSYAEPRQGGNGTSVARGVLSADRQRVDQVRVIFRAMPTYDGSMHYGSRLAFGPDGSVPGDNPFAGKAGARPEIWTLGHRNIQAAAFDPEGRLWIVEHGTNGGDELNLIQKGKNYGWPLQAYGEEYSGQPIPGAVTAKAGLEQPVDYWDPVIAPSGAQFYTGDAFPAWQGNLFIGSMKDKMLVRLVVANDRVTGEEHLLQDRGERVRDVRQGPDGALYLVTDEGNGQLWKLAPRASASSRTTSEKTAPTR
jgi:glucose/arabinose dehydrogenase